MKFNEILSPLMREEKLKITTTVDKKIALAAPIAERYLRNQKYPLGVVKFDDGDKIQYTYTLNIEYFGDCVQMMEAFVGLQKGGAILDVNTEELEHGYCLVQRLFAAMQAISKK